MKTESGKFTGAGGMEIFWQCWPTENPRAVCLIAHGLGEHLGRYEHVAAALGERGIGAFALDHAGHGRSGGKRGHVLSFNWYLADLDALRKKAEEKFPPLPCFLLGHSLGGLIAARYAEKRGNGLSGLILSSAALRVEVDAPALKLAAGRFFSKVLPGLSMSNGLNPDFLSHDPQVVAAYVSDPLVHNRVSARWFTEFTAAIESAQAEAGRITFPVLVMQSGEDKLVAPQGAKEFFDRLTVADKTLQIWDGFYHEMFNEVEKEKPISFLLSWIENHL